MNKSLQAKLEAKPELTTEIREQLSVYVRMLRWDIEGKKYSKKLYYQSLATQQPHRSWKFMEARFQEFSNCFHQLGLKYLKGLEPKKTKGVARTLGPRSIVMAVVVSHLLTAEIITEQTAIKSKAIKSEDI